MCLCVRKGGEEGGGGVRWRGEEEDDENMSGYIHVNRERKR